MARKAAGTSAYPTAGVAIEQHFPEGKRLVDDDLAGRILPFGMKAYVWLMRPFWVRDWLIRSSERKTPGIWSMVMCRKRYIDDKVSEAVVDQVDALVNLGVGFDTQAYRLAALDGFPVWEVDQSEIIEAKRTKLKKVLGEIPGQVSLVSIDLDQQALGEVLASHGYPADARTFFILEGVTQYLTEAGIRATFDFLSTAPSGSRLVFTYVCGDFIDGQVLYGQEYLYEKAVLRDKVWLFGIDPDEVADFLARHGWRVLEHLGYEELAERYVKPTGRGLASLAHQRVVYAERL